MVWIPVGVAVLRHFRGSGHGCFLPPALRCCRLPPLVPIKIQCNAQIVAIGQPPLKKRCGVLCFSCFPAHRHNRARARVVKCVAVARGCAVLAGTAAVQAHGAGTGESFSNSRLCQKRVTYVCHCGGSSHRREVRVAATGAAQDVPTCPCGAGSKAASQPVVGFGECACIEGRVTLLFALEALYAWRGGWRGPRLPCALRAKSENMHSRLLSVLEQVFAKYAWLRSVHRLSTACA